MNRTTAAAVVTTAVIGVSAGTVTAVVRGEDPAKAPTTNTGTKTPTPDAEPKQQALWAGDRFIHDGEKQVGFPGTPQRAPDRLVRAKGGYVLAFEDDLFFVSSGGSTQILSKDVRSWDLSPEGDRVVLGDHRNILVVGLDGVIQASRAALGEDQILLWSAGTVTVQVSDPEVGWRVWTWDPAGGKPELTSFVGFAAAVADRVGKQVFGAVSHDGIWAPDQNPCVGTAPAPGQGTDVSWFTCDWRLNSPTINPVSPQGTRVLVIHAQSDGFGPGAFGIVDVAKGPAGGVPSVSAPEDWMMDAAWVDEERFAVVGSNSDDVGSNGGWVQLCDVAGDCEEVARTTTGRITIGEQF